ncbi:helix-turn-helix domain-containing protein [Nocardia uniformis]|uniref:Helix-turn-helix domain-containing protein n=1 Tax=Nocardia uniformis TaxID=53432 RepID=A0A849BSC4_9NOCA|nr:ion transporter [Nocardia uniformis]NNH69532.1 helix-turn-helix domain-containing protein [Nocardia uniformis]
MLSRERVRELVESPGCQQFIIAVILINAVALGAETSGGLMTVAGRFVHIIDATALGIFVVEMLLKLYAYGLAYFRDPWNVFDFVVVGVALLPATGGLSVLRAFRILRALRLVSATPSMRKVVANLLAALPGMGSILGLLALVLYVAAVLATKLFGTVTPEHFGSLGTSMWTLFQVMTGEAWPDIASEVMAAKPLAWIFFLLYILVSTFVVLNLFLAVMVSAAEDVRAEENREQHEQENQADDAVSAKILGELAALREEVHSLRDGIRIIMPATPGTNTSVIHTGGSGFNTHRHLTDNEVNHAITLYRNGHTLAHIAEQLGVTHSTVRTALQRRGIPRRATQGRPH